MGKLIVFGFAFLAMSAWAAGPNCAEAPMTVDKLEAIVQSGNVHSQQDFLDAIPRDSMRLFTFVTNSLSLQRGFGDGKVSPMWPRVLRSTSDGKITISFVCDPRNPSYGKVEVLYFDEKTNELKSVEWDLGRKGKIAQPTERIHRDPISCASCHAGSTFSGKASLKFNWPDYNIWGDCQRNRGITAYGADDDIMSSVNSRLDDNDRLTHPQVAEADCTQEADLAAHLQEAADYANFRNQQKDNPCFKSLPWSEDPNDKSFPYRNDAMNNNLGRRPNALLTINYARWLARRNVQLFKNNPAYPVMKYFLAMNGIGCSLEESDRKKIGKVIGVTPSSSDNLSWTYGKAIGFQDKDWTLEFHLNGDTQYILGLGDAETVTTMVNGEVIKEIRTNDPAIQSAGSDSDIFVHDYNPGYDDAGSLSCVFDIAKVADMFNGWKNGPECDALRAAGNKAFDQYSSQAISCNPTDNPTAVSKLTDEVDMVIPKLDQASVDRGRKLVRPDSKGKCIMCHSAGVDSGLPPDFRFVPDEEADASKLEESHAVLHARVQEGFLKTLDYRLIKTATMPPLENSLSAQDREDIKAYIESMAK